MKLYKRNGAWEYISQRKHLLTHGTDNALANKLDRCLTLTAQGLLRKTTKTTLLTIKFQFLLQWQSKYVFE